MSSNYKATVLTMMGALMFTLSSLPGLDTKPTEESSDLSSTTSQIKSCKIGEQIAADQSGAERSATCNVESTGSSKISGEVVIQEVKTTEKTEGTDTTEATYISYKVSGTLNIDCEQCDGGVSSQPLEMTANSIVDVERKIRDQIKELAKQTKLEEKRATCQINEFDEEMSKDEQLQCHMDKMIVMEDRDARKYYDKWIKGPLSDLAKSENAQEATLAASLAAQLNEKMEVNCDSVQAQVRQASMMAVNQPFNPYVAPQATKSTPTDYIKESTCDIMALGNYNRQLQVLGAQLAGPNSQMVAQQITALQNQWSGYFTARGLVLKSTMTQINLDAGSLTTQASDFLRVLNENNAAILASHKALLGISDTSALGGNGTATDPRMLRGGGTPVTGGEQPSVLSPFPNGAGQQPSTTGGGAPAVFAAPKLGAPVGP